MKRHGWGGGGDTVFCVDVASCQEGNVPELEITVLTNIFFFFPGKSATLGIQLHVRQLKTGVELKSNF